MDYPAMQEPTDAQLDASEDEQVSNTGTVAMIRAVLADLPATCGWERAVFDVRAVLAQGDL